MAIILQTPYLFPPILVLLNFVGLYFLWLFIVIILYKKDRISRRKLWAAGIIMHLILIPLMSLSWLALIGVIPPELWNLIFRILEPFLRPDFL